MTSLSEKNTSWFVSMLCAYNNYFFNSHISLKSHFPQCLDILSLPLSFSQGVLHCQMPCFSNLQVRMKCFSISDCDPLLAFFFAFFFLASCFSNSWWEKKITLMRAVYMWELCTFSKGMRILFRGDFCIILFEVLNDLFTLSDITMGKYSSSYL